MDKEAILRYGQLDEASDGRYTMPWSENEVKYDLRALLKYAREQGVEPSKMTTGDLKKFEI